MKRILLLVSLGGLLPLVGGCGVGDGDLGPACPDGTAPVEFAAFFPSDAGLGSREFARTAGTGPAAFTVAVVGHETVPYRFGPVAATRLSGPAGADDGWVIANDGTSVRILGEGDRFFSQDDLGTALPGVWVLGTLCTPSLRDLGVHFTLPKGAFDNPAVAVREDRRQIWMERQDVTVKAGVYQGAVLLWFLDESKPFVPLDFGGRELALGIVLPSGLPTNAAVTGFQAFGIEAAGSPPSAGPIAIGEVDPATGEISYLAELDRAVPLAGLAAYLVTNPALVGEKEFTYTHGVGSDYLVSVVGNETVPYGNGAAPAVGRRIENFGFGGQAALRNDGVAVQFLGLGGSYLSSDASLSAPPAAWSFGDVRDGQVIDQTAPPYQRVDKVTGQAQLVDDDKISVDIQDVSVRKGSFPASVIFWYLDSSRPFRALDFHGKHADLGIQLPAGLGGAVKGFDIFGKDAGTIATGVVDAATGSLTSLAEWRS